MSNHDDPKVTRETKTGVGAVDDVIESVTDSSATYKAETSDGKTAYGSSPKEATDKAESKK